MATKTLTTETTTAAATSPDRGSMDDGLLENLGELPRSYGTDAIFLVAQEPHWLFTYWDIDISLHPGGQTFLRVLQGSQKIETEIEVPFETRNWYIPVQCASSDYSVEIGYYRGESWNALARSVTVTTPAEKIPGSEAFDYATVPLHVSFQKLMENIQTTVQDGGSLIRALGRLQKDGKLMCFLPGGQPGADEMTVLKALLGQEALAELSSGAVSSDELASWIRAKITERLDSAGASEMMARSEWGPMESSLFSALAAFAGSSSWSAAALTSWVAAALSSWTSGASWTAGASGVAGSSETTSWSQAAVSSWLQALQTSWSAAVGSSETTSWGTTAFSSWLQALQTSWSAAAGASESTSWNLAALSSWMQAASSSWAAAAMSSWSQAAMTSWSQAAMTSWSQAAVTSWSHAETTSWGGSEVLSSYGFAQREFFMHVNAEVIFYGGTHPKASVTVNGEKIQLNPDGSFRYHFVFPDGDYDIPIVATSPDGVETRSATLSFRRATERVGDVGHTSQPPFAAPMGAR